MPSRVGLPNPLKDFACKLARPFFKGIGCIVVLHRIVPEKQLSKLAENRAMEITPDDLRVILEWTRRRRLDVIRMDEVKSRISEPRGGKFIAFTFDDGYRDNLTEALKIFRDFGFSFTVNVTTAFVDRTASVWWYTFEDILESRTSISFSWGGSVREWSWVAGNNREQVFAELAQLIRSQSRGDRDRLMETICSAAGVDPLERTRELMLDWDELKHLAGFWHATIGAHTSGHHTLARLSSSEAKAELIDSKKMIESHIGKTVRHMAYPFGGRDAVGTREFEMARDCDYETAVTTRTGNLFRDHAWHLQALPRLGLSGTHHFPTLLSRLESGLIPARGNAWKRVVVD